MLEFPLKGDGPACARLRLTNVAGTLVAYKVKSTAPKSYVIKPSTGSIRRGEAAEVQIARKASEEESAQDGAGSGAAAREKRPDRFLVQAALVDSDEKKLLLHAAQRGKAAGAAKFWDSVPKEALEEKQLATALVEGGGGGRDAGVHAAGAPGGEAREARRPGAGRGSKGAPSHARDGMPSNHDVDEIIGKLSLPGRGQLARGEPGCRGPPGFGGPPGFAEDAGDAGGAEDAGAYRGDALAPMAPPPAWKKPTKRRDDVVLQKHSRPVTFVTLDPSGKVLFTCGKDKVVIAWSCPDGEFLKWYEGHRGAVWACSVSPDGAYLLSCGADNLILLWDTVTAQQLAEVQMPGVVRCVEWALPKAGQRSLQRRFVTCSHSFKSRPAALAVLEFGGQPTAEGGAAEARRLLTVEEPTLPSGASQVAWAGPGAAQICSVHVSGEVLFWHAGTGQVLARLTAHEGPVSQVAFPQDRSLMATCGRTDMQVRLWDVAAVGTPSGRATLLRSFQSDRPLNAVALRPLLSREEAAAGARDPRQCDCLVGGGQDAREVALVGAGTDDQFDPLLLRLGDAPGALEAHSTPGSEDRGKCGGHFGPIHALAFAADGTWCASGSEDGNVRVREVLAAEPTAQPCAQQAPQQVPQPPRQPPPQPPPKPPEPTAQPAAHAPARASAGAAAQRAPHAQTQAAAAQPTAQAQGGLIRAVAICDFDPSTIGWPPAAPQRPLPLQRGQEIEVVQDTGSGWTWGRPVGNPTMFGLLPTNYILPLSLYQDMLERVSAQAAQAAQTSAAALPSSATALSSSTTALPASASALPMAEAGDDDEEEGDCSQS